MKKLGLVGGVGPASTLDYYKGISEGFRARRGGDGNPPMVIDSLDLSVAYRLAGAKNWREFADYFVRSVEVLRGAGAELAAIAAITTHIVFDDIQARSKIPLVSIVEQTVRAAESQGCRSAIILGTRFTMQSGLYTTTFEKRGIACHAPNADEQNAIHSIVFPNLTEGIIDPAQKLEMLAIARANIERHSADSVILDCTEIPLLIKAGGLPVPLLDTTQIHIESILDAILA